MVNAVTVHAEFQTVRMEIRTLGADLKRAMWRMFLTALGLQVILTGVLVTALIELLGPR